MMLDTKAQRLNTVSWAEIYTEAIGLLKKEDHYLVFTAYFIIWLVLVWSMCSKHPMTKSKSMVLILAFSYLIRSSFWIAVGLELPI